MPGAPIPLDPLGTMGMGAGAPQTAEEEAAAVARVQAAPGWSPAIRSWADLNFWTTDEQRDLFIGWLRPFGAASRQGYAISPNAGDLRNEPDVLTSWVPTHWISGNRYTWSYIQRALEEGRANIQLEALLRIVARAQAVGGNWNHKGAAWLQRHVFNPLTLATANLEFAGYKVGKAKAANKTRVVEAARAFGIRTDISDDDLGGALVYQIADAATSQNLTLPQAVEIYGDTQVQGAGSILSEFWNDSKDWFLDAVVKNIGRAFVWVAEQILKGRENIPYLGTYFLDPLGISLTAEALRQVGEYFRTGDAARSFNERVLGFELGRHWTAFGQALIVAGGILIAFGGPLAVLGILMEVVGILMYAAGSTIIGEMKAREAASRARAAEEELEAMEKKLQADCAAQMLAEGVPPEEIPKNADKCVKMYQQTQEEKSEILSASQPAPEAESKTGLVILAGLAAAYLLTRR